LLSKAAQTGGFMAGWTKEEIAKLSTEQIETLRKNATRLTRQDIMELCNKELDDRKLLRTKKIAVNIPENRIDQYVSELHFVCPSELEVTRNQDGTIWTGTWVVAQEHAERAGRYSALVALHRAKAELSYLQGTVKAWRKSPRKRRYSGEQAAQVEEGIDFLLESSNSPLPWRGDGTGEKGYAWAPLGKKLAVTPTRSCPAASR
jgi:hypothetical protein